jgi:hypothetical protein
MPKIVINNPASSTVKPNMIAIGLPSGSAPSIL